MSQVIFCKTRYQDHGYQSYNDFFKLVELSGYPLIYVDQIDINTDNTYIYTPSNGEMVNGWPIGKAQIILWQMEWQLTDEHNTPPGVSRVWCPDAWFAEKQGYEYVPIGSHYDLNECQEHPRFYYDVSFLSYQTGRRQTITRQVQQQGLIVAPNSGLHGYARSSVLTESRLMMHVHQHDGIPGIAALRWALAAAHRMPLMTEQVANYGIFNYKYMMQARYGTLAEFAKQVLQPENRNMLEDYSASLHRLLCVENTFRKVVDSHV